MKQKISREGIEALRSTIRQRTVLCILPLVVVSLSVLGVASFYLSRSGMMRLAIRNLTFKAETLKQYAEAQWQLLESQGFSADEGFKRAAQNSLALRAKSMLRTDSEWVLALDLSGQLVMSVQQNADAGAVSAGDLGRSMQNGITGLVYFVSGSARRYGEAFFFEPFGWYIVVSDTSRAIFAETDEMTHIMTVIFVLSIASATLLLVWLSSSISRPVLEVTGAMEDVMRSSDFKRRIPVRSSDEIGVLAESFNSLCSELDNSYERLGEIALREAEARATIADREVEALVALWKVAEFRDQTTGSHIIRVGLYAKLLAGFFYGDENEKRLIYYAAPLHDIGKIGIPDAILLKPGPLSPEEFNQMKTHTTIGHSILKDSKNPNLQLGAEIALSHHERWDGRGYPLGLAGMDIPLSGRIVTVIDVFDALASKRPYKEAWSLDACFDYLASERGRIFDPDIVDAFLARREQVLQIWDENR